MTQDAPVVGADGRYLGDRYQRFQKAAEEIANGTDFGEGFLTGEMITSLAFNLTLARVLDGLTEHDADTVILLTVLDVLGGFEKMAWRLTDWWSESRTVNREDDDTLAVMSVLARIFAIYTAAYVGEEFERAQQHYVDVPEESS